MAVTDHVEKIEQEKAEHKAASMGLWTNEAITIPDQAIIKRQQTFKEKK